MTSFIGETGKARARRERDSFFEKYTVGQGLDIGCGLDPLTPDCDKYDFIFGNKDATLLPEISKQYSWVYSSHCLEHLKDPSAALKRWWEVVIPGGFLIVAVPHRDLYEKRLKLPSHWNRDHKWFFLPEEHVNSFTLGLRQLVQDNIPGGTIEYLLVCNEGWVDVGADKHSCGEYQIEIVVRKVQESRP